MVMLMMLVVVPMSLLVISGVVEGAKYECQITDMYNYRLNEEFDIDVQLLRNNVGNNDKYGYITIIYPDNTVNIDHDKLNNTGVNGKYIYHNYSSSRIGEHFVLVRFYDEPYNNTDTNNNDMLTECVNSFNVGGVDEITFGQCPMSEKGQDNLWYGILILVGVGLVGMMLKNFALTGLSGMLLLFMTLVVWNCGMMLGIITILLGLTYIVIGLSFQY